MKDYSARKAHESLQKWYDRIADTADTRLRNIEKLAINDKKFATAPQWAYARAMQDIKKWGGKKRFSSNMPQDPKKLMAKISDIRAFLRSPTSTKSSIVKIYDKRLATFASTEVNAEGRGGHGVNFTWETLAKYFETGISKNWKRKFGSNTALKVIGVLQKNKDLIRGKLANVDTTDFRFPVNSKGEKDTFIMEAVKTALKTKGLHIKELIK